MNWRIKRFLQSLLDGEWRLKAPKGVGVGIVRFCIERGLVRTKMVNKKRKNHVESYQIALHISNKGKIALKRGLVN